MMPGMVMIESPHNPAIRAAVALRARRDRVESGLTLVDGVRECRRAIDAGVVIESAFTCHPLIDSDEALEAMAALRARAVEPVEVSERAFSKLAFGDRAEGIVLVVRTPSTELGGLHVGASSLILVTEDVEKPGNLGAIIRTADAAGCDAVIAIDGTDLFNPNVIRASIGTVFSMPLAAAPADAAISWLRQHGIRIVAARVDAERVYSEAELRWPLAIVLGSEAVGLSDAWRQPDIEGVYLPMLGVADSLNVSATAAILAFEARRQRGISGRPPAPARGGT